MTISVDSSINMHLLQLIRGNHTNAETGIKIVKDLVFSTAESRHIISVRCLHIHYRISCLARYIKKILICAFYVDRFVKTVNYGVYQTTVNTNFYVAFLLREGCTCRSSIAKLSDWFRKLKATIVVHTLVMRSPLAVKCQKPI